MPYSLFKRLGLGSLKPIKMTIEMADRSMQSPKGIKENVLVKISNFVFPVDFVVLDIMKDENISIILGRPMLATAHAKIDVYVDKTQELNDLVMKVRDFENYLSPKYGSQDIISLSPSELAKDKEEFSMTLGDLDKRMSIGLDEFVDIDDMWDDLDPGILSNEKATTKFLKSDDIIYLHNLDNLQLSCKIGFGIKSLREDEDNLIDFRLISPPNFKFQSNAQGVSSLREDTERISKKRTKNEAKNDKTGHRMEKRGKDKVKTKPKCEKVNPDKSKVKPEAISEEK
ncbi:homeodomain-like protein [Tanacetum coccineum]